MEAFDCKYCKHDPSNGGAGQYCVVCVKEDYRHNYWELARDEKGRPAYMSEEEKKKYTQFPLGELWPNDKK